MIYDAVVGVDLGIRKLAYSIWRGGELTAVGAVESKAGMRQDELFEVADYLHQALYELVEIQKANVLVVIEEPLIGNNRKYSMKIAQTYGAVLASLAMVDANPEDGTLEVLEVNVGTWKKQVIGDGHADKESIRNYIRVVNQRYSDLCGYDQDKYDAACVGLYGVLLSARADGLLSSS